MLSADDFESSLDSVREAAVDPIKGIFGPESLTWRVDREAAVFLGGGRALLLQLAHPWVAAAVSEHSRTFADPVGRFHRTFNITFTMVFGSLDQALAAGRRLHRRHAGVTGILPQAAGRFEAGSAYSANEVSALRWVHATLVESALQTHDLVLPALTDSEREQYWAEAKLYAALFGIRQADLPPDWTSFTDYTETMSRSDVLAVSPAARAIAEQIFSGRATGLRVPRWYRALTAHLLPERLAREFGLEFGEREQRSMDRALTWIRRIYPHLPMRLRAVGPYQEALARLQGDKQPDLAVRWLNRLWIGRPMME
ncbi:oxygenase MpaB family protein [Bradyrhizobium sp. CSA112]|uniref:oxygenase MpaB family protein n=1 Tax=Bradyrhizobium sp. CSA112 TaxID=2699170 RepID=UPI0023AE728B|nr:oxygenase MpaB family protein [Bradyrhizobium sp. CSA112]